MIPKNRRVDGVTCRLAYEVERFGETTLPSGEKVYLEDFKREFGMEEYVFLDIIRWIENFNNAQQRMLFRD